MSSFDRRSRNRGSTVNGFVKRSKATASFLMRLRFPTGMITGAVPQGHFLSGVLAMTRSTRIAIIVCLSVAFVVASQHLQAGHGGGGHSGGGGHGGGGGHSGGGGHGGGGGGVSRHVGGSQHLGTRNSGGVPPQHFGGAPHNRIQHQNHTFAGSQNHQHNSVQQHLGNTTTDRQRNAPLYQNRGIHNGSANRGPNTVPHRNSNFGNTSHQGSQFLQQQRTNSQNHSNVASLGNTQHHGSQFLQKHGAQTRLKHSGSQNQGLPSQHLRNNTNAGNSTFLAHHHQASPTNVGIHHTGRGNRHVQHHGVNHAGSFANANRGQNFSYRDHHGGSGVGIGGNGMGYRHHRGWGNSGFGYGRYRYGGFGSGWGSGFYPAYYGFGFGLAQFGYGWGYGFYGGSSRWGCFSYQPCCYYQPYAYNYGNSVYGDGFGGYDDNPYGATASLDPGLLRSFDSDSLAGSPPAIIAKGFTPVRLDPLAISTPPTPTQVAGTDPKSPVTGELPTAEQYAQIGETAFKARDYKNAVRAWRHGLIDDPNNGVLVMMLAQALFATEQYNAAAGATQFGMQLLEQGQWETVVKGYRELYGKVDDYTAQLRVLEKAARSQADDPALRFLLGYHYGFLGYSKEATQQLEKCVSLAPEDETAQKLLELFNEKLPKDVSKKEELPAPAKPPGPSQAEAVLPLTPPTVPPTSKTPEASDPE